MSRVSPVGGASPTAARSREVYPSRIMRDKTGDLKKRQDRGEPEPEEKAG
jgi:hypothetical protein